MPDHHCNRVRANSEYCSTARARSSASLTKRLSDGVEAGALGVGEVFGQLEQTIPPPSRLVEREAMNDELVEDCR